MKITAFEIERFGLWTGLKIPKLSSGLNVFYGGNETGKSTLMEFVRAELYGFVDERRRYARKPGTQALWNSEVDHEGRTLYTVSGGVLELECPSGQYRLRRMFLPDRPLGHEERIELKTLDGEQQGAQLLRVLVSGVDEPTFNNVFAIGLDELQKLGSLNDTEAAEMLFRLSVGMDRISIVDAIKELTSRRNRIFDVAEKENKPSFLTRLIRQREKLVEDIDQVKVSVRDYVRIRTEQRGVDRGVSIIEEDIARLQREKRLYEIAKLAEPIWARRDKVRREIDAMGTVQVVTEENVAHLEEIEKRTEERKFAYDKLREEYTRVRKAVDACPVNETLWKLAPRIEVLLEEEKRIVEIDGRITTLESEIASLEADVIREEENIKRGRRSLPKPNDRHHDSVTETHRPIRGGTAQENVQDHSATEHASFTADGAVISAQSTLPSVAVSVKGHRPNVGQSELIDAATLEDYRVPARAVHKARQRLHRYREQHAEIAGRSKILNEKVKTELDRREVKELSEAIEKANEAATHLRRRQGIGQRLAEMTMQHKELHRINAFLVRNQALPTGILVLLVAFGVAGAIPLGLEFFHLLGVSDIEVHPVITVLGLFAVAGSFIYYFLAEKNNTRKLQRNQRQLGMLLSQIEHAKQEAAAIDSRFPSGSANSGGTASGAAATAELRYQQAQQELAQLEKLVPVDAQRRETDRLKKQIESRLERAKEDHKIATRRWNDWLRVAGLPADWTPAKIRDLMDHCDVVGDLKKELDHRYESMNQQIRDMRIITDRIDRMIVESGLSFADGMSYVDILNEIRKKIEANDQAIRQRDKLKSGIKEFRKMRKKAVGDLRKVHFDMNDLLRSFEVKTPPELRELHRRHLRHRKLLQQEQGVQRELDAAIGTFCEESTVENILEPRLRQKVLREELEMEALQRAENIGRSQGNRLEHQHENLYDDWENSVDGQNDPRLEELKQLGELPPLDELTLGVVKRIETASAKLRDEMELRGKLTEQLKQIAEDRTALEKQRELAILNEKIERAQAEWQNYAVCAKMLDVIRVTYERERQPRTLSEASEILRRLTDGKYLRIWTPLGEETLLVDDVDGNTFDVGWLSRGTREQLFIALRLALASAFAQHGSILPLILDDVFVNFDSRRALAASKVLVDLAKSGRQIFLFTCHEHVCRIFQKLDVPVRILPAVDEPEKPTKVLLPMSILRRRERIRRRRAKRQAAEATRQRIEREISDREEAIRLDALRRAEVQRLILQMQQQATAEKAVEAEREALGSMAATQKDVSKPVEPDPEDEEVDEEWWEDEEDVEDANV